MNLPIKIVFLLIGVALGGAALGALASQFMKPAAGTLSPFLIIAVAILIAAVGYTASVFLGSKKK